MDITAVLLARVILWFPAGQELTAARVPLTDAARAIAARYAFEKYPQSADEWKADVGAEFKYGRWNDTNIPQVTIYQRGVAIDTQTDTDDSDKILDDLLAWAPRELNISLQRRPDERKLYVSQLVEGNIHELHVNGVRNADGKVESIRRFDDQAGDAGAEALANFVELDVGLFDDVMQVGGVDRVVDDVDGLLDGALPALRLARRNVAVRKTQRAYSLLAQAVAANQANLRTC